MRHLNLVAILALGVIHSSRLMAADADVTVLIEKLAQTKDSLERTDVLQDIAKLGTDGKSAGPAVKKLLEDPDWDVQVAAARTIGYIGAAKSIDVLIDLMERKDDWRLPFVAAESLGQLKVERAEPALSVLWNNHWYPPVCDAAGRAIGVIHGKESAEGSAADRAILEFFKFKDEREKIDRFERGDWTRLRLPINLLGETPLPVRVRRSDDRLQTEHRLLVETADGHLIINGEDNDGGAIEFVDKKGNVQLVSTVKTKAIYKIDNRFYAVTGPTHPKMKEGFIQMVEKADDGRWITRKFRSLPGEPEISWLLKTHDIAVSCTGGMVKMAPDGEMKFLTRKQVVSQ